MKYGTVYRDSLSDTKEDTSQNKINTLVVREKPRNLVEVSLKDRFYIF
jgi:hypothetical protein